MSFMSAHPNRPPTRSPTWLILSNFAEWDPGVVKVEQIEGDGAGPDAVFDVAVKGVRWPADPSLPHHCL